MTRFWAKVNKTDTCWLWTAATSGGYGVFWNKRQVMAHRFSYEALVGQVPPGYELDHLCRNRACVNPSHLEPVTHQENLRRSPIVMAKVNAQKDTCPQGHELCGDNLRIDSKGWRRCRACARAHSREWYAAHSVQMLAAMKRRYANDPEPKREYQRRYHKRVRDNKEAALRQAAQEAA